MKTVWILNHYAVPPGTSGGTRHFCLATNLPPYGWRACIIASSVEHLSGKQRLVSGELCRLEKFQDIPFLWLRTAEYIGNGGGRMRNMLEYAWRAWLRTNTRKLPRPDAIIGSSVHPFAAVTGALLANRFGVPFVFEVRDLWPQTLIDLGRIGARSVSARLMRAMERWLYGRADRIVTLLPRAVDYIVPMGVAENKVVWIPNGVELSAYRSPALVNNAPDKPFTLMYFGAHGQANALDDVLRALALLQDQAPLNPIQLRLIGDGPAKASLRALASQLKLCNVSFEPPVSKSAVPSLAAEADAFVLPVSDKPDLYRYGISPNKLYDYFAAARPIILASAAVNDPVLDAGAGLTVPPENPAALANAITTLAAMPASERNRMGAAGRRYVEQNNDFRVLAGKLASVLDECVAAREARRDPFPPLPD